MSMQRMGGVATVVASHAGARGTFVAIAVLWAGASALVAATAHASAAAESPRSFVDCDGCPEMVVVPPGEFEMGHADGHEPDRYEGPVRRIAIRAPFALGRHEVTNAQYGAFVAATGHESGRDCYVLSNGSYAQVPGTDWRDPGYGRPIRDDEPVACVTWRDARAYVAWLAERTGQPYRLPSEAEWEYAARAGRSGRFVWGDDHSLACREANVFDRSAARERPQLPVPVAPCDDGFPHLAPVGRLAPNAFGLHDMIGNVWEWVEDCYSMPHPYAAPTDGRPQLVAGCDRRGTRGGSWISSIERQRPSFRGRDPESLASQIFGFRVARDVAD